MYLHTCLNTYIHKNKSNTCIKYIHDVCRKYMHTYTCTSRYRAHIHTCTRAFLEKHAHNTLIDHLQMIHTPIHEQRVQKFLKVDLAPVVAHTHPA